MRVSSKWLVHLGIDWTAALKAGSLLTRYGQDAVDAFPGL